MTVTPSKPAVFPVTLWQQYLLEEAAHPDCLDDLRDRWIITSAYLIQPGIDLRRFKRAVEKLRARHDSLRIRFAMQQGVWRALIDPPGGDHIRLLDLPEMDDDRFLAEISAIANAAIPIVDHPVSDFVVVRSGNRGDVLIVRLHHAIIDGYGIVTLMDDLFKFLSGIPVTAKAISHSEYLTRFHSPVPSRREITEAFWKEMHQNFPPTPNVGRKAKGLEPLYQTIGVVDQRQLICSTSPHSNQQLENRAGASGISPAMLLYAGFLESLCQCYDLDQVMFTSHVSRTDTAMDTYIGDHTLDIVLPYFPAGERSFADAAEALRVNFMNGLAHLPSDAARKGTPHEIDLIKAGSYPRQFSVYQPRVASKQNKSVFRAGYTADYGQPQQIGPVTVTNLDVRVRRRRVSELQLDLGVDPAKHGFELHYDGLGYTEEEIRKLADMMCHLLELDLTKAIAS
ncbi:MAG: condensation domain-containing protein [Sulfitobacter sp.]